MRGWYKEHIYFRDYEQRRLASIANFPKKFSKVTLILDGKAIPYRRFNAVMATTLHGEPLTKTDYMCYKHKPAMLSLLFQVIIDNVL